MLDAYIYDGLRSPVGRYGGGLTAVRSSAVLDLGTAAATRSRASSPDSRTGDASLTLRPMRPHGLLGNRQRRSRHRLARIDMS
jgi:hypothetical protein